MHLAFVHVQVETYKVVIGPRSVSQQCSRPDMQTSYNNIAASSGRLSSAAESNSSLDGLVSFFQDCVLGSDPMPALAPGASNLAADMVANERHLAGDVMAPSVVANAFAAAAMPAKPEAEAVMLLEHHYENGSGKNQVLVLFSNMLLRDQEVSVAHL